MPLEIKVGPPVITISQGRTFVVSDLLGGIGPATAQGVYMNDTRFLSSYALSLNGHPLEVINSSQITFSAARFHLTNPEIPLESGNLAAHTLHITLDRSIQKSIHEDLQVANYTGKRVHIVLELTVSADFADIFEVRNQQIVRRGEMVTSWETQSRHLRTSYQHGDFRRAFCYTIHSDVPVSYSNGRVCFSIDLQPNHRWHACCALLLSQGEEVNTSVSAACPRLSWSDAQPASSLRELDQWQSRCTGIATSNNDVFRMYQQAIDDMRALRISDMDISEQIWVPAAGVPWFVTLFGRDSLIVSYQNMLISPGFARGALKRLAEYQASERDDWRDAQPGKILHEVRFGELAHFRQVPFTPYYGTADATILYLIVLSETYRWTGDLALLQEYREVAQRCLCWVDQYGDLDGDGFQEYKTFSQPGYENLGWKDAFDAVMYADGTQVRQPKALCELQGYVYDAKVRLAEIFQALGDQQRADTLSEQAQTLKRRFNELFWMEEEGCYAFGLDSEKQQITSLASNAGQCLWSGIAEPAKAARTARRLLREDMWSGWGIRTLSAHNPAYNPFSYHNGSIWPHDNGIIAEGFKRYGLIEETHQVVRAIFDAVEHFEAYRPPEVFAGITREGLSDFPVLYPGGANIPQAWATGCIFHMLRTLLGLRAAAAQRRLYVRPTLPTWLPDIDLHRLQVGSSLLDLRFWRDEDGSTRWRVLGMQAERTEDLIEVLDDPGDEGS